MSLKRSLAILALIALGACSQPQAATTAHDPNAPINVATTISTLNSMVEAVGGSHVTVHSLVPIGASPETYQPTPQNIQQLAQADLLVENGAGLETWLQRTIANAGSKNLVTVVGSDGLKIQLNNPHLWMDPQNAKTYIENIRAGLAQIDPTHTAEFATNAKAYDAKLDALTASIQKKIDTIPPSKRYMIVFHNAWLYYNARFGITTLGFIEQSPGQDPNPRNIAKLIDLAKAHGVSAIFSEPEYSPKLAYQIASGAHVQIVTDLYDDSIGTDPRVKDYLSMLDYDTDTIVKAMR